MWRGCSSALRAYQAAEEIDPYNFLASQHAAKLGLAMRDYEDTRANLVSQQRRWPLAPRLRLDQAQVQFSQDGELARFAAVVDGDFEEFDVCLVWRLHVPARQ